MKIFFLNFAIAQADGWTLPIQENVMYREVPTKCAGQERNILADNPFVSWRPLKCHLQPPLRQV